MELAENGLGRMPLAILRLRGADARCSVTLLPLVDTPETGYRDAIFRELQRQDVVLFETGDLQPTGQPASGGRDAQALPALELITQRGTLHDARERDGLPTSDEVPAQEFGRWWQGFPVAGGPHTSVALFRTVVMAVTPSRQRLGSDLTQTDEMRLKRLVLSASDRSIEATVERLYEALRDRALFVAILLNPRNLETAAKCLRLHHGLEVIEKSGLLLAHIPSMGAQSILPSASLAAGGRLMRQLAERRRRNEALLAIKQALRLGAIVITVLGVLAFLYYGFTYSAQFEWTGLPKG